MTVYIFADNLGPQIIFCPANQSITPNSMTKAVSWTPPVFKDNSGMEVLVHCNRQSGDLFYWGEWNVYCRAYDNNPGNEPAVCHFIISLKRRLMSLSYPTGTT